MARHLALLILLLPAFASAEIALGIAPLDTGISVWKLSDHALVGFELKAHDLAWNNDGTADRQTRNICTDLSAHWVLSKGTVARLLYTNLYFEDARTELPTNRTEKTGYGIEAGFGGWWKPMDRVSVLLRQGIAAEYNEKKLIDDGSVESLKSKFLRMYNARLFILFSL